MMRWFAAEPGTAHDERLAEQIHHRLTQRRWMWAMAMVTALALAAFAQSPLLPGSGGRFTRLQWSPALFVQPSAPAWLAPGGAIARAWMRRGEALWQARSQAEMAGAKAARAPAGAQNPVRQKPGSAAAQAAAQARAERGQAKHIFFIIPAFNVEYLKNVPPLTPHEKFTEMLEGIYDYDGLGMSAAETLLEHDSSGFCGYGHGWGGFGKCYAAALADADDSSFLGDYLFNVWFHEDPRYFRLGDGYSIPTRIWYAVTRVFVAKKDHGGWTFALAPTLGTIIAASASNLYYPKADRGVGLTASRIAWDLGGTAIFNLEAEFWKDIHRKLFGG